MSGKKAKRFVMRNPPSAPGKPTRAKIQDEVYNLPYLDKRIKLITILKHFRKGTKLEDLYVTQDHVFTLCPEPIENYEKKISNYNLRYEKYKKELEEYRAWEEEHKQEIKDYKETIRQRTFLVKKKELERIKLQEEKIQKAKEKISKELANI